MCFLKKVALGNFAKFTVKYLCEYNCGPQACNLIEKEIPTEVCPCEFREIFKNNFFTEHSEVTAFLLKQICFKTTCDSALSQNYSY